VQADERRLAVGLADQQRDMLAGHLVGAEGDDLGIFRVGDRQVRARDDAQAVGILMRVDVGRGDRFLADGGADEERRQQPGHPRETQRGGGQLGLDQRNRPERTLQRRRQIELRIGQRGRGVEIEPGRPLDQHGRVGCRRIALVCQLQGRSAAGGKQQVGLPGLIERPQPLCVGGLHREQRQLADRNRPAAAQRIDGAGGGMRAQKSNSVTIGT
jgi:hypothetical protein